MSRTRWTPCVFRWRRDLCFTASSLSLPLSWRAFFRHTCFCLRSFMASLLRGSPCSAQEGLLHVPVHDLGWFVFVRSRCEFAALLASPHVSWCPSSLRASRSGRPRIQCCAAAEGNWHSHLRMRTHMRTIRCPHDGDRFWANPTGTHRKQRT